MRKTAPTTDIPGAPSDELAADPTAQFIAAQDAAEAQRRTEIAQTAKADEGLDFGGDPETPGESARDQMIREFGEEAVIRQEQEMMARQSAMMQEAAEIPQAIQQGLAADTEESLRQQSMKSGIDIGHGGNISQHTRLILTQEPTLGIYVQPEYLQTTEGPQIVNERRGEINGVPFRLQCSKFIRVPESIAQFAVCQGWCPPPLEKTLEWQKHIPSRQREINLARITPGKFGQEMTVPGSFLGSAGINGGSW